jgi:hypothetical protein
MIFIIFKIIIIKIFIIILFKAIPLLVFSGILITALLIIHFFIWMINCIKNLPEKNSFLNCNLYFFELIRYLLNKTILDKI